MLVMCDIFTEYYFFQVENPPKYFILNKHHGRALLRSWANLSARSFEGKHAILARKIEHCGF